MEKNIVFGSTYCFTSKKTGDSFYKIDYIDLNTGRSKSDYISSSEYNSIKALKLKTGTTCIGIMSSDDYDKLYVSSIKI